jgi:hypothetical protein
VCRKTKYILQKPTPKIKQPTFQLATSQLFQKLKSRSTNKHDLNEKVADKQAHTGFQNLKYFYNREKSTTLKFEIN